MASRTDRSLATPREREEINLEFSDEWSVMSESSLRAQRGNLFSVERDCHVASSSQ
ncbi:MAG: hypothetical protein ACK5IQ_06495 [Bacteroidales bacterium]